MKDINSSGISGSVKAPFVKRTHDHYCEAIKENDDNIVKGLLGSYTDDDLIILWGAEITGTTFPGSSSVTEGAIYYNGEIYPVDANPTITTTGSQVLVWVIETTYAAGDPVIYTDNVSRDQHRIKKIKLQAGLSGSGIADYNAATVRRLLDINRGIYSDSVITFLNSSTSYSLSPFFVKKDNNGRVSLKGAIAFTGVSSSIASLPAGFRPVSTGFGVAYVYLMAGEITTTPTIFTVVITTLGNIQVVDQTGTAPAASGYVNLNIEFDTF